MGSTWVLIIMLWTGGGGGSHMIKIDGFSSQTSCLDAKEQITEPKNQGGYGAQSLYTYCVEVR